MMSFEKEGFKREFILDAHLARKDPNCHIFDDVATLSSERKVAFCHSCSQEHEIPSSLDVLFVGPSCKDISKCNPERNLFMIVPCLITLDTFCMHLELFCEARPIAA